LIHERAPISSNPRAITDSAAPLQRGEGGQLAHGQGLVVALGQGRGGGQELGGQLLDADEARQVAHAAVGGLGAVESPDGHAVEDAGESQGVDAAAEADHAPEGQGVGQGGVEVAIEDLVRKRGRRSVLK
jgi:hypothetical protein